MQPSLTVVLPVHNAESTLRRDVTDVLEAAAELSPAVEVLVIDDASTDDTFESAADLSREFRQVRVLRRSRRQDLAECLRDVRATIASEVVIVHDGSSRVNPDQLRLIWRQQQVLGAVRAADGGRGGLSFADLRRPSMTQPAMEVAHHRLWGFQRVPAAPPEAAADPTPVAADAENRRTDNSSEPAPAKRGVGAIPRLPRANMLGSITDFALGE